MRLIASLVFSLFLSVPAIAQDVALKTRAFRRTANELLAQPPQHENSNGG